MENVDRRRVVVECKCFHDECWSEMRDGLCGCDQMGGLPQAALRTGVAMIYRWVFVNVSSARL